MHADEHQDAAVGGGAREDRQDREQQQGSEAVTLALAAARIGDRFQGGEQASERHHGGLQHKRDAGQPRTPGDDPLALEAALTRSPAAEPNSPVIPLFPARSWPNRMARRY